jgi:hypothetical protein
MGKLRSEQISETQPLLCNNSPEGRVPAGTARHNIKKLSFCVRVEIIRIFLRKWVLLELVVRCAWRAVVHLPTTWSAETKVLCNLSTHH